MKQYRPLTPAQRHRRIVAAAAVRKQQPMSSKLLSSSNTAGRNNTGTIVIRRRGGGVKQKQRIIENTPIYMYLPGIVQQTEYNPRRSAFLRKVSYYSLCTKYVPATGDIKQQQTTRLGLLTQDGDCSYIKEIPPASIISNIEKVPAAGIVFNRAAGTYGFITKKDTLCTIRLQSGKFYQIPEHAIAFLGRSSNIEHKLRSIGKAGVSRLLNKRPSVRGVAMNPVDHPHGGRTSRGRPSSTPWGKPTKGYKTSRQLIRIKQRR